MTRKPLECEHIHHSAGTLRFHCDRHTTHTVHAGSAPGEDSDRSCLSQQWRAGPHRALRSCRRRGLMFLGNKTAAALWQCPHSPSLPRSTHWTRDKQCLTAAGQATPWRTIMRKWGRSRPEASTTWQIDSWPCATGPISGSWPPSWTQLWACFILANKQVLGLLHSGQQAAPDPVSLWPIRGLRPATVWATKRVPARFHSGQRPQSGHRAGPGTVSFWPTCVDRVRLANKQSWFSVHKVLDLRQH